MNACESKIINRVKCLNDTKISCSDLGVVDQGRRKWIRVSNVYRITFMMSDIDLSHTTRDGSSTYVRLEADVVQLPVNPVRHRIRICTSRPLLHNNIHVCATILV